MAGYFKNLTVVFLVCFLLNMPAIAQEHQKQEPLTEASTEQTLPDNPVEDIKDTDINKNEILFEKFPNIDEKERTDFPNETYLKNNPESVVPNPPPDPEKSTKKMEAKIKKYFDISGDIKKIEEEEQKYLNVQFIPTTLEGCLTTALENNLGIKIVDAQKEISRWFYYKNATKFLPDINYKGFYNALSGTQVVGYVVPIQVSEISIYSSWYVYWDPIDGLAKIFKTSAAKKRYFADKEALEAEKNKTLIDVTSLYYRLLQQKLNNQIFTKNLKEREGQLKLNKQRFKAGIGTKFDVLRAESEVAKAQQLLLESYNRLRLVQAQLANTIGICVFAPLYPKEEEVKKVSLMNDSYSVEFLGDLAFRNRPDLAEANLKVKAAEAERRATYANYIPRVQAIGVIQDNGTKRLGLGRGFQLGVFANWYGGNGLGLYGVTDTMEFQERYKQEQLKMIDLQRNIQQNVISSFYESHTTSSRIDSAEEEVKTAEESLRLSILRLSAGIGIFVDVLQAQAAYTQARINLINVIIDYNISQAKLLYDTGVISVNHILNGYYNKCNKK